MDKAIWLASFLGPFLVIMGVWMLAYSQNFAKVGASLKTTPSVFYLMMNLNVLFGLTVLRTYSEWTATLASIVTLWGWVWLVRGVLGLFVPNFFFKLSHHSTWARVVGVFPLIFGVLMCWYAYGQ